MRAEHSSMQQSTHMPKVICTHVRVRTLTLKLWVASRTTRAVVSLLRYDQFNLRCLGKCPYLSDSVVPLLDKHELLSLGCHPLGCGCPARACTCYASPCRHLCLLDGLAPVQLPSLKPESTDAPTGSNAQIHVR